MSKRRPAPCVGENDANGHDPGNRKNPHLNAHLQNPDPTEIEVTDPAHPLFGRRFTVRHITHPPGQPGYVFVAYRQTLTLRIPLVATDAHPCPLTKTPTKWTPKAVADFLALFAEVPQPCPLDPSGEDSRPNSNTTSNTP